MIAGEEGILIKYLYLILMKNQLGNAKQCKNLIKKGHVFIHEQCIYDPYYLIKKEDKIYVDGNSIKAHPFQYFMMNKPQGYICASYDKENPYLLQLMKEKDCYCVGRLDKDTTGFVLLTNDASLSKKLLLPQNHVEKVYQVKTKYPIFKNYKTLFEQGIIIDKTYLCQPAKLEMIDSYQCHVTLHEGKYHQVKKMFMSLSNEVVSLKRISFAGILLDESLQPGEYRHLNEEEMTILEKCLR